VEDMLVLLMLMGLLLLRRRCMLRFLKGPFTATTYQTTKTDLVMQLKGLTLINLKKMKSLEKTTVQENFLARIEKADLDTQVLSFPTWIIIR
jgi:hypothetical protein